MSKKFLSGINVTGTATLNSVANAGGNTNKFLVLESDGSVKYRTSSETAGDIGAVPTGRQLTINGITYDLSQNRAWTISTGSVLNSRTVTEFTATAGQTTFNLTYNPNGLEVFYNGSNLDSTEYTASNGTSIVLTNACNVGDVVKVISLIDGVTVSGVTPISFNSANGQISIQQASGSQAGYLSSTDWTTFNNKVSTSRTLTINGTAYDLSADRSWSIAPGGTSGQILAKNSGTDYDWAWIENYADWTSQIKEYVKAGEAINKGQAVYVSSADGTNMIVSKASNATEATSSKTLGLLAQDLALNGKGYVITDGLLTNIDTSAANAAGDPVWLGTNGNLIFGLVNKPAAPAHLVYIGVVTRKNANTGEIFVHVQNGFELKELHDISIVSEANNQALVYESSTGLWKNKTLSTSWITEGTNLYYTDARVGSYLTTNSYATQSYVTTQIANLVNSAPTTLDTLNELAAALGNDPNFATTIATSLGGKEPTITAGTTTQYWRGDKTWQTLPVYTLSGLGGVPTSRTITINGVAYDLTADRSWSIAAGVTSFNTRTGAITLSSSDVTTALGFTPYNNTNPSGYISSITSSMVTTALGYTPYNGATNPNGYITGVTNISGYSGTLSSNDIRTLAPNSLGANRLAFGFTSWNNNNTADWADYLHLRSYGDGSGGADNLVMFKKNGIGMRIWQQSFGSATAYSVYADVLHSSNYTSYAVPTTRTITINGTSYDLSADRSWTVTASATQLLSPNGATVVAADSAMPNSGHSFIHTLALGPGGNDGHILGMTWASTTSVYGAQIWLDTDPTNRMAIRSRSGGGVWNGWWEVLTQGNYSSYALPLSGGSLSGQLTLSSIASNDGMIENNTGGYFHLGGWGVSRTHATAILVNTAYWADNAGTADNSNAVGGVGIGSIVRKDTTGQYLRDYYEYGSYLTTEAPSTLVSQMNGSGGLRIDFMGGTSSATGSWSHVITFSGYNRYSMCQIGTNYYTSDARLYYRQTNYHDDAWAGWKEFAFKGDNANFGSISASGVGDFGPDSGNNNGIGIHYGSTGYGRIRFYNDGTNHSTIHSFGNSWAGGMSVGCINIDGNSGVTFGAWNDYDLIINRFGNIKTRNASTLILGLDDNLDRSSGASRIRLQLAPPSHTGDEWKFVCYDDPSNAYLRIGYGTGTYMQLIHSGTVTFAGDVVAYSDARVKENVKTISNALETTLRLRGVIYNRTDSDDKTDKVGLIAQEVLEVLPEVVTYTKDSDRYGVSYGNITALLIESIKEQQKQIEELKIENDELRSILKRNNIN